MHFGADVVVGEGVCVHTLWWSSEFIILVGGELQIPIYNWFSNKFIDLFFSGIFFLVFVWCCSFVRNKVCLSSVRSYLFMCHDILPVYVFVVIYFSCFLLKLDATDAHAQKYNTFLVT